MGFSSPYEAGRVIGQPQPVQYMTYQNQIQNQNQNPNQIQPVPQQKVTPKPVVTLPPKLFDFDPDFFKGVENIEKSEFEGGKSEGQMKNGLLEGKGRLYYDNGEIYEGEWKNDQRDGKGIYKFPNGNAYKGDWKENKRDGYGIMKFSDCFYEGEWIQRRI